MFYDQVWMGDLDPCFNKNKNHGIFDLKPLFNAKQEAA